MGLRHHLARLPVDRVKNAQFVQLKVLRDKVFSDSGSR